jgi:cold shock CspA family protein/tetratricopeptide (TPR) repeat protein
MYSATRLTIFALISAVEQDLRDIATDNFMGDPCPETVLGDNLFRDGTTRFSRDFDELPDDISLAQLLPYIDIGDTIQLINRNREFYPPSISGAFRDRTEDLVRLVPIRNRIAHTRPLDYDDLAVVTAIVDRLIVDPVLPWIHLRDTTQRLTSDPGYVFGLTLPPEEDPRGHKHNLPLPDFEDTGFFGRSRQRAELVKLCLGAYPVISVVGDGAVGKTALALAAAYDLLDRPDNPFDAIVWSSAKATRLTPSEIVNIEDAIRDSLGMFQQIATYLAGESAGDPIDEVLAYLEEFKVLLILDNLETVLDDRLRQFLAQLPTGSKVLITSRVGLGAYEYPVKLGPMEETDAIRLLRAIAQLRGVDILRKAPPATLASYCRRMFMSPGFIKWFVFAVQTGVRPETVLANTEVLLDFCMTNVYEHLGIRAQRLLAEFLVLGNEYSLAELSFVTGSGARELESVLGELLRTNMVSISSTGKGATPESTFRLSDLAREFLAKHHPVASERQKEILAAKRQLVATQERLKAEMRNNPYSGATINVRSRSDLLVVRLLSEGLSLVKRQLISEGLERIEEARLCAPDFYEVFRVLGFVKASTGDLVGAREAYETAISLEPKSAPLRSFFGGFLLRFLDDADEACRQFEVALTLDPDAVPAKVELARCFLIRREFGRARGLFDSLLATERLPALQRRKIYDLHLQWFARNAEQLLADQDAYGCLAMLEGLRHAYEECPADLLDALMRARLGRAELTARLCAVKLEGTERGDAAARVWDWLISEGLTRRGRGVDAVELDPEPSERGALGERVGTIKSWLPDRRFGFIRSGGEEFFFHFDDLLDQTTERMPVRGERVTFSIREHAKGPRAVAVCLVR